MAISLGRKLVKKHGYAVLVIFVFLAGTFLRLYNFQNRLIFGPEQGMSLMTSAANLSKFSLLGETNWIRTTSTGLIPFHGALYSYLLLPFIVLFNFRVMPITLVFTFLNLLTAYFLFIISKKLFGKTISLLSLFYFLFSAVMVHHSFFTWIVNPTPLLATLSIWFIAMLMKNKAALLSPFVLGLLSGIGFGMQNFYIILTFLLFIFVISVSKRKFISTSLFLFGIIVGNLPTLIFDLRHDFYHFRVFWQFFLDVLAGKSSGEFTYYNFLYLYPYLFIGLAFVTNFLFQIGKPFALVPVILFIYLNYSSPLFNPYQSTGMPPGITLSTLEKASGQIATDKTTGRFNVVTLWDFDTRAHTLRYLLKYYYGLNPEGLEEYSKIDTLYAFAPEDYDIVSPKVYELESFFPYKIEIMPFIIPGYRLYKLTK